MGAEETASVTSFQQQNLQATGDLREDILLVQID